MSLKKSLLDDMYAKVSELETAAVAESFADDLVYDEDGTAYTIEEAQALEEDLAKTAELYFVNHPVFANKESDELVAKAEADPFLDEDETTVTLSPSGEVISQTTIVKEKTEVLVAAPGDSFINDIILTNVIQNHIEKMKSAENKLVNVFNALPIVYANQGAMMDNLIDKSRKERRELTALMSLEPITFDKLESDDLKRQLRFETKEAICKMFQVIDMLD